MLAKRFVALLLLLVSVSLYAASAPPVDGVYWDPTQGGRGYAVETQDDLMFVAIYDYDTDGSPAFYTIQGAWNGTTHQIQGAHLLQVTSGPWIGGPFSPVGSLVDLGAVTFQFTSFTTATFTYNGHTAHLERFLYGYGGNADSLMSGIWHASYGGLGVYFGDVVNVLGACTIAECASIPEAFQGVRLDGGSDRVLVGGRQSDGRVFFLLDSSTSYYDLYVFDLRVNDWVGWSAAFLKTDNFPTNGLTMFAHRLLGPNDAPSTAPAARVDVDGMEAMKAATSAQLATRPAIDGKSVRVDDIEAMLPALKQALAKLSH
ncbi:MAG TPA: hypothetical protein VFV97_02650 [Rhodanobacteraceae bacterium]|nr:hypothetical protein [Rhodanobacteraceae bacterium]